MYGFFLLGALAGVAACGGHTEPRGDEGESVAVVTSAVSGPTVAQQVNAGCTTAVVKPLNAQVIAEMNCTIANALAPVPKIANFKPGSNTLAYLETPARDALVNALKSTTMTLGANSMLRTVVEQYVLYRWYQQGRCGISLAATPGTSNHESGLAIDTSDYNAWKPILEARGFRWLGANDPVHFDYVGPGAKDLRGVDVKAFQRLWNLNNPNDKIAEDGAYGPATAARLAAAPANGFDKGVTCAKPDGGADGGDAGGMEPTEPAPEVEETGEPPTPTAPHPEGDEPHRGGNEPGAKPAADEAASSGCAAGGGTPGSSAGGLGLALMALVVFAGRRRRG